MWPPFSCSSSVPRPCDRSRVRPIMNLPIGHYPHQLVRLAAVWITGICANWKQCGFSGGRLAIILSHATSDNPDCHRWLKNQRGRLQPARRRYAKDRRLPRYEDRLNVLERTSRRRLRRGQSDATPHRKFGNGPYSSPQWHLRIIEGPNLIHSGVEFRI